MEVREIVYGSSEYRDALTLREKMLRLPLGKTLSTADLAGEAQQLHFGAFNANELIACVLIKPLPNGCGKLRQMAVAPAWQGKGMGRKLIEAAEKHVAKRGFTRIEMAARKDALGFYQKLGYEIASEVYVELGIEHLTLCKSLLQK